MSPEDKRKSKYGEYMQGEGLVDRKLSSPHRSSVKKRPRHDPFYN